MKNSTQVEELASDHDIKLVPLLTNFFEGWRGDLVEALVTGPSEARQRFIEQAVGLLKAHHYAGITVDFEDVDLHYAPEFNRFLARFAARCHEEGLIFILCVPVGYDAQVFDLDLLARHVDHFLGMLYHENSRHDPSGPLASQPWFERWLHRLLEFGHPQQWIIGIGAFGCDWPEKGPVGGLISFAEAMSIAQRAGLSEVDSNLPELNPNFSYSEDNARHSVWFLDAITALNQMRAIQSTPVAGVAVWRLGFEDPKIWEAIALARSGTPLQEHFESLGNLGIQDYVAHVGDGEIVWADRGPAEGHRALAKTTGGAVITRYTSFPSNVTLQHYGEVNSDWIALTFDDGPDPEWTPKILDILRDEKVKATFFVIGRNVENHPELVERMYREGHEVGVHTYTHPNLATIPSVQVDLELNATQRLLESILGHSTILFRPPYMADSRPQSYNEVLPILRAQKLGYLTLCENIDPEDWSLPVAEVLLHRVQEMREFGSVVLLHDGGGSREQTVEALPGIIHWLRESSDDSVEFVTASRLLGLKRDEVMPPTPTGEHMSVLTSSYGLGALHFAEQVLWAFMIVASVLVILRTLAMAVLAVMQKRWETRRPLFRMDPPPGLTVVIAAYNEEKVIAGAVQSVLSNGYAGDLDVILVDDGSTDRTVQVLQESFGHDARVRVERQSNCGKSTALRRAFALARHDFIATLDADTQLVPNTLHHLVARLKEDPRVGAVSGNAKVGNRGRWLTEFQGLEYICGFNLDRRAYAILDCITVVPGAIGAYRRQAVEEAGGFTSETLAEDTDLTLQIRKNGWRIAYEEKAVGWTESPETVGALAKQRFRWAFGTLQCLWKHRDALFNPKCGALGWVALPSLWFFQIGLVAAAPLVDALMILSLLVGNGVQVALFFTAFILSDILLAAIALRLEGEPLRRALWAIPQRFVYRPLLSFMVWRAIQRAARGAVVAWGKQDRKASVKMKPSS